MLAGAEDLPPGGPGEELRFSFRGVAGRSYAIGVEGLRHTPDVENYTMISMLSPDGKRFAFKGCGKINGRMDDCRFLPPKLPVDGVYTLVLKPPYDAMVSGRLRLMEDVVMEAQPPAGTRIEIAQPGQVGRVYFSGKAGERVGVALSGIKLDARQPGVVATVRVHRPDGVPMATMALFTGKDRLEVGPVTLPVSGTYAVSIDPHFGTLSADISWSN